MKRLMTLAFAVLLVLTMPASPVFRVKKTVVQSDGSRLSVTRTGADHVLYYLTDDGMVVFPNAQSDYCYATFDDEGNVSAGSLLAHEAAVRTPIEQRMAQRITEQFFTTLNMRHKARYGVGDIKLASVASKGDVKVPVILAEFSDVAFKPESNIARFDSHLNGVNYTDEGGAGSVRDYFMAQSDGQFRPRFDVLGKVKVSKRRADYGANSGGDDKNATGFIAEAVDSAEAHGIDFSPYKNSKGEIMVTVIYPGHGEQVSGNTDEIWAAYYWSISHTANKSGLKFKAGFVMDELADYGAGEQFDGIGTFCHEFSHALGLPDFYNSNNATGIFGMDAWDLMDYGQFNNLGRTPVGYTAYEREFLGWMKIDTLRNEKQLVTLPPLHSNSPVRAYRIPNPADKTGNEYYLLENREKSDWFLPLYGEGMLITHVDYNRNAWTNKSINNNRYHQRMTIIPADGVLTPISDKASTYKGDLWPGRTNNMTLNSTTTPCDTAYVGRYMGIRMNNIHRDGLNNIVFYYQCSGQLGSIRGLKLAPGTEDFSLTATFKPVENAERYVLALTKDNQTVRTDTIAAEGSSGSTAITFSYPGLQPTNSYTLAIVAEADDWLSSPQARVSATVPDVIARGDVNRDHSVNTADVVAIYSYIISGKESKIDPEDADVDQNGQVNSADVVAVYNIIID